MAVIVSAPSAVGLGHRLWRRSLTEADWSQQAYPRTGAAMQRLVQDGVSKRASSSPFTETLVAKKTPADIHPDRAVELIRKLMRRFKGSTFDMLEQVLLPLTAPITKLDRTPQRFGKDHKGGTFKIASGTE
jgi:hypothetical protein